MTAHSDLTAGSAPIENIDLINKLFSAKGTVHDLVKSLEAHDSEFAKSTLKKLCSMSPLSIGVTFEQIKRG